MTQEIIGLKKTFKNTIEFDNYILANLDTRPLNYNLIESALQKLISPLHDKRLVINYYNTISTGFILKRETLYRKTLLTETIFNENYKNNSNMVSFIYENNSAMEICSTLDGYAIHHIISDTVTRHEMILLEDEIDIYNYFSYNMLQKYNVL